MKHDERVLVVDLDGTLIRSDMLFETFWASFSETWTTPVLALSSLIGGRAGLKQWLCTKAPVKAALLPYNPEVIAYIEDWRANGGRTALVTASDQSAANAVAGHVGLFDEAYGSEGRVNLKGEAKARFLLNRFGEGGFDYIGDGMADLPVWTKASKAITINAPQRLRAKVDSLTRKAEHLTGSKPGIKPYIRALRPHQWLKNILVFVPMIAAHAFSFEVLWQSILAFVSFSLLASSAYVLNDLLDLASDRIHPRKRLRPFASGDIPIVHGTLMAPALLIVGLLCALPLGWLSVLVMAGYLASTLAYSLDIKRRMGADICMLAVLYTARVIAGGVATDIPLSVWLLSFSMFFFFSLAALKRYAELIDGFKSGRITAHGRGYQVDDLPIIGAMTLGSGYVSILVLALYLNSATVAKLYNNPTVLWGVCLILLYWISRMVIVTHRGSMHDDPIVYAVKDRASQACLILIFAIGIAGAIF